MSATPAADGPPTMAELLGTADEAEQRQQVAVLLRAVRTAPITITITLNQETQQVAVLAHHGITFDEQHAILAIAGQALRRQELQQLQQPQQPGVAGETAARND